MTMTRRKYIGYEITCDAHGCRASTANDAPKQYRRTSVLAVVAALTLSWVETRIGGQPRWVCPMHQTFDRRLGRWVATPLAIRA